MRLSVGNDVVVMLMLMYMWLWMGCPFAVDFFVMSPCTMWSAACGLRGDAVQSSIEYCTTLNYTVVVGAPKQT